MSKTPIILKKEDSNRPSRSQAHQPIQPKILTKAIVKENVPVIVPKKPVEEGPKILKTSIKLMSNFQLDMKFLDYLDSENR